MIPRQARPKVESLLSRFPAVGLLGPRQAGKTTLAKQIARQRKPAPVYLDLELPSDRAKLSDPELFLRSHDDRLVVIDEVQLSPGLFSVLRGLIDERIARGRTAGQFLLLGSAAPAILQQSAQSLAGRIAYLELTPFLAEEVGAQKGEQDRLWNRGGFPKSYLAASDSDSLEWRLELVRTYLERDVPALGPRIPAETLRRFWTMLAHQQGALMNAARLATSLAVSGQTVARYLDLLTDLLLVRQLRPWSSNEGKRLVKSPKVFIRDSGLTHALLGLASRDDVLGHPVAGHSWEGFVIENLIAAAPTAARPYFYRTSAGAEIDLLIEVASKNEMAIEIKRTSAPVISPGFRQSCDDLKPRRRFVLYAGDSRYPLDKQTEAISLPQLVAVLSEIK